jgi:membrane protein
VSTLVRREIELARVEITGGISRLGRGAATAGIGGALIYAGAFFLLLAAMLGLVEAGVDAWLAALIVGAVVLAIGGALTAMGLGQIREANLAPTETAETVKENVEYVKEQMK